MINDYYSQNLRRLQSPTKYAYENKKKISNIRQDQKTLLAFA